MALFIEVVFLDFGFDGFGWWELSFLFLELFLFVLFGLLFPDF